MHRERTGCPWRDVPGRYGPKGTLYKRKRLWAADGTWQRILDALRTGADTDTDAVGGEDGEDGEGDEKGKGGEGDGSAARNGGKRPDWPVAVDSTVVRAHQHAAGAAHAPAKDLVAAYPDKEDFFCRDEPDGREALGRSRGGHTTKVHLAADARCRPLSRVTTPGQRHDTTAFEAVMAGICIRRPGGVGRPRTRPSHLLGDKAYSSRANRAYLRRRKIKTVVPERDHQVRNRKNRGSRGGRPPTFDQELYKLRNVAERTISKLKQFRAVATRYDKRDYMYQATVDIASIKIWLRDRARSSQSPG